MRDFCRCCTRTHALEGETALEWECVADCVLTATQQQQQQPKQRQRRRERARRRRRRHNSFTIKNVGAFAYALSHSLSVSFSFWHMAVPIYEVQTFCLRFFMFPFDCSPCCCSCCCCFLVNFSPLSSLVISLLCVVNFVVESLSFQAIPTRSALSLSEFFYLLFEVLIFLCFSSFLT